MTVESNRPRSPQSDTQVAWAACRPKRSGEGWSRPCAVARVRAQCLAGVRQWQTDNGYWVSSVLADAQEHPWRLEIARSYEADFNAPPRRRSMPWPPGS